MDKSDCPNMISITQYRRVPKATTLSIIVKYETIALFVFVCVSFGVISITIGGNAIKTGLMRRVTALKAPLSPKYTVVPSTTLGKLEMVHVVPAVPITQRPYRQ